MAAVLKSRMADLLKLRAAIYNHSYNPLNIRTGNKILRQRLRGPLLAAYYPRRIATHQDIEKMFPEMESLDEDESDRWDSIALRKARGKGNPKKKRTPEESKKFAKRKPNAPAKAAPAS